MKIPYGISNFKDLREQGYVYVDKTAYLERLENLNSKYLLFIRPRRFGKSLFLSVLEHYYSMHSENDFERLFGDLYIGKNQTAMRNKYFVLRLNFSGLKTSDKSSLQHSFLQKFKGALIRFFNTYASFLEDVSAFKKKVDECDDFGSLWDIVFEAVEGAGQKLYLIIDEYDHFANDIIAMGDGDFYHEIIHASGFVRDFYEVIKFGTESVIDRIFMTGVSPIMLDDLTSGFNITDNLTMNPLFNEMLGFTDEEVSKFVTQFMPDNHEYFMEVLRNYYNGYLFNVNGKSRVYNPDMILYFFNQWSMLGQFPEQMVSDNVKTDYGRLKRLISNERNAEVLDKIVKNETITANIVPRFSFDQMNDERYFVSLLFYLGFLTIDRKEELSMILKIPNYVIKTVFWEFIERRLRERYQIQIKTEQLRAIIGNMAYRGEITPLAQFISDQVLKPLSNRDLRGFNEKHIKSMILTHLASSQAYVVQSEKETDGGYIDIFLERAPRNSEVKYEWLIELKYIKKSERHKLAEVKAQGLAQIERYAKSRNVAHKGNVKQALLIFIGKDEFLVVE